MIYKVLLSDGAIEDLENAIEYHLQFSKAKAIRLEQEFSKSIKVLEKTPYFRIRYDNVRCLPLGKKLTYMLHYVIDEENKSVYVFALFNTMQDPEKYPKV